MIRAGLLPLLAAASLVWGEDESVPANPADGDALSVTWEERAGGHVALASGVDSERLAEIGEQGWNRESWERLMPIRTRPENLQTALQLPPVSGSYRIEGGRIVFAPRFPLSRGVLYRASFFPGKLPGGNGGTTGAVGAEFRLPALDAAPSTVVETIYPTAEVLPENLLKFYIAFSAPMSRGRSYTHIALREEGGAAVDLPFLELGEELWNPEMTRLTLFIDPGRIKRGVRPLEEIGPALETGKSYTLSIAPAWRDARNVPLKSGMEKAFRVGPPDREPPDPSTWTLTPPLRGTLEPLVVGFGEPLDHALVSRMIDVLGEDENYVPGSGALHERETEWRFIPESPWKNVAYRLAIQAIIEDLAGNNIGKPFEVDLEENITREIRNRVVYRGWEPR